MFVRFKWGNSKLNYMRANVFHWCFVSFSFSLVFLCCVTSKESKGVFSVRVLGEGIRRNIESCLFCPCLSFNRWFFFFFLRNLVHTYSFFSNHFEMFLAKTNTKSLVFFLWWEAYHLLMGWDRSKGAWENEGWEP